MIHQQSFTLPTSLQLCHPVALPITVIHGKNPIGHPSTSSGCPATKLTYKGFSERPVGLLPRPIVTVESYTRLTTQATPHSLRQSCSKSRHQHPISELFFLIWDPNSALQANQLVKYIRESIRLILLFAIYDLKMSPMTS